MLVREAIDSYYLGLRARDLSPRTIVRYTRVIEPFARFLVDLGVVQMTQLRSDHLRKYITARQTQVSAMTVHHEVTPLKSFTAWLTVEELIDRDPFRNVRKPKLAQREVKIPNAAAIKRLLGCFDKSDPEQFRDLAIIKLIASTGIRRSEALGARLGDLDVPERTLLIHGKGRKDRRVRLSDDVAVMIHRYVTQMRQRAHPVDDTLFVSKKTHGELDGSAFGNRFAGYVKLANLGCKVTLHTLRHWAASSMLSNGAPLELVSRQLGHADSTITSRVYAHVAWQDVAAMHATFDPLRAVG